MQYSCLKEFKDNEIKFLIDKISLDLINEKLTDSINIEFVDFENKIILARTGFDDNGKAKVIQINKKLKKITLFPLLVKTIKHELAHIETELHHKNSNHNLHFKLTCKRLGIDSSDKILLSKYEIDILKGEK